MGTKKSKTEVALVEPAKEKYYPSFRICSDVLPELVDYKVGETIEIKAICKVKGIQESYNKKGEYDCDLEMKKADIENLKEERKESKRLGIDKKDFDELKKKKEKYA